MQITSKERQEVAEHLRHAIGLHSFLTALSIDTDSEWNWMDVSDRVAELIDPTCHLVSTTFHSWSDGSAAFYHELSCGHICETVWGKPPSYCPECGARLVDEDDH